MSDNIIIPKKYHLEEDALKKATRESLCNFTACCAEEIDCIKCAFYNEENFNKFINEVGL